MSRIAATCTGFLMKAGRVFHRLLPAGVASRLQSVVRRHLIPSGSAWVQVQRGFAEDLWIQIDLASERTWWAGSHEPTLQRILQRLIAPGVVFFDVGAHIGFFSLPAARAGARVVALEPDPENAARLRAHVDRNHLEGRIQVVEAALWSRSASTVSFRRGVTRSQGGVAESEYRPVIATGPTIQVASVTLDDLVGGGAPDPAIVKIDVEGTAGQLLAGAIVTVRRCSPLLIVEVHTRQENEALTAFLQPLSYDTLWDIPPQQFPRQCYAFPSHTPAGHRWQSTIHDVLQGT